MKTVYTSTLVIILVVLAISTGSQSEETTDCPKFCTFDYNPVCGYNGNCYRNYGNACTLKVDQCSSKEQKNVKAVDMSLCLEAQAKSNPDVIVCKDE